MKTFCAILFIWFAACETTVEEVDASSPADSSSADSSLSDSAMRDAATQNCTTPPCYAWARLLSGPSEEDEIDAVASDNEGNVYVSGKFETRLSIEGAGEDLETPSGSPLSDIMVAKYSPEGELLWVHQFGGAGEDNVFDAACDDEGHLYLSGHFSGDVDFGGQALSSGSTTNLDMMVIRMTTAGSGSVDWAIQAGGPGADGGNEINLDASGRLVVLAGSDGDFSIERAAGEPLRFTHEGGEGAINADGYLLVLDRDTGAAEWAIKVGGNGGTRPKCLSSDPEGNFYFGGDYRGELTMDSPEGSVDLPPAESFDAFISSWTSTGEFRWSHAWGGPGEDLCKGAAATTNQLYLVGYFQGNVAFGSDARVLESSGRELYVWSLNADGTTRWLERAQSSANLLGAEALLGPDDGVIFGFRMRADVTLTSAMGTPLSVTHPGGGRFPLLVGYNAEGTPSLSLLPSMSVNANLDEMSLSGRRLYIDVPIITGSYTFGADTRSSNGTKDALIVAVDL